MSDGKMKRCHYCGGYVDGDDIEIPISEWECKVKRPCEHCEMPVLVRMILDLSGAYDEASNLESRDGYWDEQTQDKIDAYMTRIRAEAMRENSANLSVTISNLHIKIGKQKLDATP